jgi:IS30 family transposase
VACGHPSCPSLAAQAIECPQSRVNSNFPKGFDFSTVTEAELDAVADELNHRPRKRLGFANPNEQLSELLLQ